MSREAPLVAHVIHRLDIGGLENGLVNLVNHMPPERIRHAIVCLSGFNPEFRRRIRRPDVEVVSLGKRPGKDLRAYGRMWRLLRRMRPAIVHTRNLGTVDMQWVAAAAGVPRRLHGEHGWEASDPTGRNPRSLRIRRACRPVIQRYVCMSQDIARWLERDVGVAPSRIRQLYSGVDVERFKADPAAVQRVTVTLGTVGRLDPVKNHASLLEAFASLRERVPGVHLTIVGDGPLRPDLEARIGALGLQQAVHLAGACNDTAELIRSFDVFVLPSINEGISNTLLEAMATGLPVVAARVGGNPELVMDGVTGRLYDPGQAGALARAVLPYLTDPALRRAHGAAGRERVVQNFSLDTMVGRYVALYDEVMTDR
jgi:sugar transferase (PEP-CTERM/EpsH1 system associated)